MQNYANIPFALSRRELLDAAEAFMGFLSLPRVEKEKFVLLVDPEDEESVAGYVRRRQKFGHLDEKEYFHFNRYALSGFDSLVQVSNIKVRDFFDMAYRVYVLAEKTVYKVLEEFDTEFPGIHKKFFPARAHPRFYLRFLKYNIQDRGDFLAKGHYDQGGCTLALAESAPGLRIGRGESDLTDVKRKEGHVVFMPGFLFPRHTSKDFFPAWHDVIQKSTDAYNADTARWAIVFFADPYKKTKTKWAERHAPKY